jgi:hypothetical protein
MRNGLRWRLSRRKGRNADMTIRNLDALFAPKSVALIGASDRSATVGGTMVRNLLDSAFRGRVIRGCHIGRTWRQRGIRLAPITARGSAPSSDAPAGAQLRRGSGAGDWSQCRLCPYESARGTHRFPGPVRRHCYVRHRLGRGPGALAFPVFFQWERWPISILPM